MQALFNQLVYFALFQSLFLLGIYALSAKQRKKINPFLILLVLALAIGLIGRVLYITEYFGTGPKPLLLSELAGMMFGPTLFLLSRASFTNARWQKTDWLHFLPAAGYMILIYFCFVVPDYNTLAVRAETGELTRTISVFHAVAIIVNVSYWVVSFVYLMQSNRRLKSELSYVQKRSFLFNLHIIIAFCFLCWVALFIISLLELPALERDFRHLIWIVLAFIVLFISFYSMLYPQIFQSTLARQMVKYNQSKLSIQDLDSLKLKLDELMLQQKPYLNKKLMKAELAEMMGISNPELARLLNEGIGMNFFEYVNFYRIKAFIELAQTAKAKQLTLFGLAQEVGFNSKTTFNTAFKKLMGTTPSDYFSSQEQ